MAEVAHNEIHVDNMHFRVSSVHPDITKEEFTKRKEEMRKELYKIFKNY